MTPNAVLFATSSFWQGVDVKGEALSAVIIDKLPFQVPSDPLVSARMACVEEQGDDLAAPVEEGLPRLLRADPVDEDDADVGHAE